MMLEDMVKHFTVLNITCLSRLYLTATRSSLVAVWWLMHLDNPESYASGVQTSSRASHAGQVKGQRPGKYEPTLLPRKKQGYRSINDNSNSIRNRRRHFFRETYNWGAAKSEWKM